MADVARLVEYAEEAESGTVEARELSERDRDYHDTKQWTDEEEATLKWRKQPVATYNRVQRKIDFLSGLERQQRKDPKAFPRTPGDEAAAHAATDAIRYVCDDQNWDNKRSDAWENILIEGTGAVMVGVKQTRDGYDPSITHIPWDRFFADPKASRPDFSDARYMGVFTWYDMDDAQRRWEGKDDELAASLISQTASDTYEDKPKFKLSWGESKTKRVRVCEIYYKERGQWWRCVFTKGGHLEGPEPSPYLDEDGAPENPIKAVSLYVDRDNNRFGQVRVMISPQEIINKTNSKWMHFNNMRQARVSPTAMQDAEKIRKELARPDGLIIGEKDDFEILPTGDLAAAQFNMLRMSMAEIDLNGGNAALAGKNENDMSGRAILAQQQGGLVEVARGFDRLRHLSLDVYRSVWNRIRQVWTAERWIRVTDDERNLRFVGLNQKVTVQMLAEEAMQGDQKAIAKFAEIVGEPLVQAFMQGDPQAQMMLGLFVQQNGQQVVETRNAVNELDVDIVIDEGMDTPTVQAEQFDQLVKMVPGMFPQGMPPRVLEILVEASSLRDKEKLLQIVEQMSAPAQPDPMEEQVKQLQLAGAAAEVDKTQSEAEKNRAQAATAGGQPTDPAENMFRAAEIETDQFNAVTDRMQAMQPAKAA
jgi:hypothetical protein